MGTNNNTNYQPRLKFFSIFSELAQIILIICLIAISIASFGNRIPLLASYGLNFFAVTSGSMTPKIPVGAIIKSGKYKLEDLKAGDIITFQIKTENNQQPIIVTHRIKKVDRREVVSLVGEGENKTEKKNISFEFTTQGDANNAEDSNKVKPADIIGLYEWHIPYLGFVTSFVLTPVGFICLVIVPALILIIWEVISLVLQFKKESDVKSREEIEKLKAELAKVKKK